MRPCELKPGLRVAIAMPLQRREATFVATDIVRGRASYYFKVPELVAGPGDLGLVQLTRDDVARMVQRAGAA